MATPALRTLQEHTVPHRVFKHPGKVNSLEQAALERNQTLEQVVRSILFRIADGDYVMVLVAGAAQISWPALRKHLGVRRTRMASPEEAEAVAGAKIGAVSPFGLPKPLRLLVDYSVFIPQEISVGSGRRGTAIIMSTDALRNAIGDFELGQFVAE